ncbi:hypothetical protein M9979_04235 [Sphingomonas sp. RP10(2022)]|uniref:DUF11 domain-containing protein n=1 Tax=Sphingomonas liriopis TaxID=2949094 RepID=A0A9X2HRF1_9SPHN|nr:hypothetical protein [Sphingomonas liriopis]MCP3734084.1 hypothetical protein [Sphingomonas liriopis]
MTATGARRWLLAGTAAIASIGSAQAQTVNPNANGTLAGTTITNTATASYTVNGTAGTATSNTATFLVDRKVNLTVVPVQNTVQVNLGQTGAYTSFQVTNATNDYQDFLLSANQTILTGILTGTDTYDLADLKIYVDSNGNGTYDAGVDTAEFIDELAPDGRATVFVVGNIPASPIGTMAQVGLQVRTAAGGGTGTPGAVLVASAVNLDNQTDVVFADDDNDGLLGYDALRNGAGWAYGSYDIGVHAVNLTVAKSASVVSDGVSALNPKALPGAIVQYCLTVTNGTLTTPASGINLTDVIPANTTYVPGSITIGGLGTNGVCLVGGFPQNDDGTQATGPYRGSYDAGTKTVTATIPTLLGGTSLAASFRVKIN